MQCFLFTSFATTISNSPTLSSTDLLASSGQPLILTPATTTQSLPTTPSMKDYIPVPIVSVVIAGLIGIIATLIWKWHEAEIKRIEEKKDGEIKLLGEQKKRELSEKDNQIAILEEKITNLKREQEVFRELTSIAPLEYLKETKPCLENLIQEYKKQIEILKEENDNISEENKKFRLSLENQLATFENNLQKLSALEKHLADRVGSIKHASLWLNKNRLRLGKEASYFSLRHLCYQGSDKKEVERFINDINDYLFIVGQCLDFGRPNLLYTAKSEIPPVIHPKFYAEAFKIIRDKKAPEELSNENSAREIEIYLNYLISLFESEPN